MPGGKRSQGARVVDEAGEVVEPGRLGDPVEEPVDARRAVVKPPRAAERDGGIVTGERRQLTAVRALVEREQNDGEAGVVSVRLEQWAQPPRPVGRNRDVRADVAPEPLGKRAVVIAQAADMELHHEPVVAAHPCELVEHVRLEAARVAVGDRARERRREQRGRLMLGKTRRVGARCRVIGRGRAERLERSAPLGEHVDERRVVAHLAACGGLELGERSAPAGRIERDDRVGAKGRPDAKRRFESGECAVLLERRARGVGRRQALDAKPVEQRPRSERRRSRAAPQRARRSSPPTPSRAPPRSRTPLRASPAARARSASARTGARCRRAAARPRGRRRRLRRARSVRAARPASRASARRSGRR